VPKVGRSRDDRSASANLPYRRENGTLPTYPLIAPAIAARAGPLREHRETKWRLTITFPRVLETTEADRLATGFIFTEGPLWHPDGFWYFVDLRRNHLHRLIPGKERTGPHHDGCRGLSGQPS
jgi:hypothetical protein